MIPIHRIGLAVCIVLGLLGAPLHAQSVSLALTLGAATHDDIGRSTGLVASVDFGRVALGLLGQEGTIDRFDTPCGGFIPPTGCEAENIQVRHSLRAVDVGRSFAFALFRFVRLYVVPHASAGIGSITKYRADGSRSVGDSAFLLGGGVRLSAEVLPVDDSRVRLLVSASGRRWIPMQPVELDSYQPFSNFSSAAVSVGAVVSF